MILSPASRPGRFTVHHRFTLALGLLLCAVAALVPAHAQQVHFAGLAFAGDHATIGARFPYLARIERARKAVPSDNLSRHVIDRIYASPSTSLQYGSRGTLASLKGSDQTLLSILLITGESVSTEEIGSYYKTFINLRGEALIFDYKSKSVVRSYPVSASLFDATGHPPSSEAVESLVHDLLVRSDGGGLITQYTQRIAAASLPNPATRTFQVRPATLGPEALAVLPDALRRDPALAGKVVSEALGSIMAAKLGVSLLPTAMGSAMGTMSFRLDGGEAYDVKIGEGDYLFDLSINRFVKVKSGENAVGASWVYGVHANLGFIEPALGTVFLRTDIKNGEVKTVPTGQATVDDYPAYEAAMRGLFIKFSDALQGTSNQKWILAAAAEKAIEKQLDSTRHILKASK